MIIKNLTNFLRCNKIYTLSKLNKPPKCDHVYFPEYVQGKRYPIGKKCSLCGEFHSCEELGIQYPQEPPQHK
jgi:hypothetical protein